MQDHVQRPAGRHRRLDQRGCPDLPEEPASAEGMPAPAMVRMDLATA